MNINFKNIIQKIGEFYKEKFPTLKRYGLHHAFLTVVCIYFGSWFGLGDFMANSVPIFYLGKEFKEMENRGWVLFETMDFFGPVAVTVLYYSAPWIYNFFSNLIG
jgi:hypothetical protein